MSTKKIASTRHSEKLLICSTWSFGVLDCVRSKLCVFDNDFAFEHAHTQISSNCNYFNANFNIFLVLFQFGGTHLSLLNWDNRLKVNASLQHISMWPNQITYEK